MFRECNRNVRSIVATRVWPVHGLGKPLALPKCRGTVAFCINIRLSEMRFASQFPTILFLYSLRFQLASASLPSFLSFFFYRRTVGRCTHFGYDSPLMTTVTPTTPPQIRFASHNTSIIGLGNQVMLSRSLRVKSDTQLGFVGNKLHSSKQIK